VLTLGVPLWRLVRVPVLEQHLAALRARGSSNHNRPSLRRMPRVVSSLLLSIAHLARLRHRRVLVLGFPRRHEHEGEWVDPFSDPLIDTLEQGESLCIERPYVGEHYQPARTREIVYYDWVPTLATIASHLAFVLPLLLCRRQIRSLADRVHGMLGVPRARTRMLAARAIVRFWIERYIASAVLRVVRPEVVLLTIRRHHYAFINACRPLGIRVYELQHGAIAEGGYKYSTPYDPSLDPDAFLTFGDHWNAMDWGMAKRDVLTIGFKYIADRARLAASATQGDKVMLVSQPQLWRKLADAYGRMVRANPDVRFILRLHPQDVTGWERRYPFGEASNVEVSAGSGSDLYAVFRQCACAIGYDSTVLFEASFFGLAVGILNEDGMNRCSALAFKGRFGFYELRAAEHISDLLRAPRPKAGETNPFFAEFELGRFESLLRRGHKLLAADLAPGAGVET
jgi:hypothetical protein